MRRTLLIIAVFSAPVSADTLTFTDATGTAIQMLPEANGPHAKEVAFGDFDNDGDQDAAVSVAAGVFGSRVNKLYRNDGGVFIEVSGTAVIPEFADADVTRNIAFVDLDADGWLDLLVVNDGYEFDDPIDVFMNRQVDGVFDSFSEQGEVRGLGFTDDWPCGAIIDDLDHDGDIDLAVGNYGGSVTAPDSMYFNDGNGFFTDVTATHLPPEADYTIDMAAGDLNGDGKIDMIVGNGNFPPSTDPFWVYYNDNNGNGNDGVGDFRYGHGDIEAKHLMGLSDGHGAMRPADFDGDGDLDLYWGNRTGTNDLIVRNDGNDASNRATFTEVDVLPDYVRFVASNKATITDLNDDGRPDLVIMTANRPAFLLNTSVNGGISFVDWTPGHVAPAGAAHMGMHAAIFDTNGDGARDIFIGGNTGDHVFHQESVACVDESALSGSIAALLNVDPVCVEGTADVGQSDEFQLPDVTAPASLAVIVTGPDDYLVEVLGDCTPAASSDRGGAGVEEAIQVTLPESAEGFSVRVTVLGAGAKSGPYTLELLARTDGDLVGNPDEWASTVIDFSTQYSDPDWAAHQATGLPNTGTYGDIPTAWAPLPSNGTLEYITLGFDPPRYSDGVTIRETFGNGFVYRIDVVDTDDNYVEMWSGVDPSAPGSPVDFEVTWPETDFLVKGVKIYVDTDTTTSWEEIDAVNLHGRLEGDPPPGACCPADIDGSGAVDFGDILLVLSAWGPCAGCPEDLDESGDVGFADLVALLAAWGPCA